MRSRKVLALAGAALVCGALAAPATVQASPDRASSQASQLAAPARFLGKYDNVVVIYQENHSFDNLYGRWGRVGHQKVIGLPQAGEFRTKQVDQAGKRYTCLLQNDVNLTSPPQPVSCTDAKHNIASDFKNRHFKIENYIQPEDTTCPIPGATAPPIPPGTSGWPNGTGDPGGCTRDLVHRFYQEQYQLNGGHQNRYVTGSDAVGLTMGTYDTKQLPIYEFLHGPDAPHYVIADKFFQGAFGGSFLNHQWLIAGRAPFVDPAGALPTGKLPARNSILDTNGMPTSYPLYTATSTVLDGEMTTACSDPTDLENYELACGNFAVNTVQPTNPPFSTSATARFIPLIDDTKYPNIGDRMTDADISWNWYSGGWDDAEAGTPGPLFQYHHQPFNYFADYAPGQPGRDHLQDETDFFDAAESGTLPTVSFVKPYGAENEHPGYASATSGSMHLVDLIQAVLDGPQADNTLVIVTYDEFGGQWDHVPPPGMGTQGAHDAFGPSTRIPALLVSARMTKSGVDHTVYDTTSIIASVERSYGLDAVGIRDTRVHGLRNAVKLGG